MLLVEIILLLIIIGFALSGAKGGFVRALGQLIGAIIGFLAARAWSPWLTSLFTIFLPGREGIAHFIAFLLIFLVIDRLVGYLFIFVSTLCRVLTHLPIIKQLNAFLGGILGFAEGITLVGSTVYLVLATHMDPTLVRWLSNSIVAGYCERVFSRVLGYLL